MNGSFREFAVRAGVVLVALIVVGIIVSLPFNETQASGEIDYCSVYFEYNGQTYWLNVPYGKCAVTPNVLKQQKIDGKMYDFDGWSLDGVHLVDPTKQVVTGQTTYQAMFTRLYDVTFVYNNKELTKKQIREGGYASVPDVTGLAPVQGDGFTYDFVGWTTDGKTIVSGIDEIKVIGDMTYYAMFKTTDYWVEKTWTGFPAFDATQLLRVGDDYYYFVLNNHQSCTCYKIDDTGNWVRTYPTIDECDINHWEQIVPFTDGERIFAYISGNNGSTRFYQLNEDQTEFNLCTDWTYTNQNNQEYRLGSERVLVEAWTEDNVRYACLSSLTNADHWVIYARNTNGTWQVANKNLADIPNADTYQPVDDESFNDHYNWMERYIEYYWNAGTDTATITTWQDNNQLYLHFAYTGVEQQVCYVYNADSNNWQATDTYTLPTTGNNQYQWQDGEHTYCSQGTTQTELVNGEWVNKAWHGLTDFDGTDVWSHAGQVYYSKGTKQYVLLREYFYTPGLPAKTAA